MVTNKLINAQAHIYHHVEHKTCRSCVHTHLFSSIYYYKDSKNLRETPQTRTLSDRFFFFKTGQVLFCVRGKEQRSNYKIDNLMMHSPKFSHQ